MSALAWSHRRRRPDPHTRGPLDTIIEHADQGGGKLIRWRIARRCTCLRVSVEGAGALGHDRDCQVITIDAGDFLALAPPALVQRPYERLHLTLRCDQGSNRNTGSVLVQPSVGATGLLLTR